MITEQNPTLPKLVRTGIDLGDGAFPLISGSLDYFRVPHAEWARTLSALKRLGVRIVETCVPWSLHQNQASDLHFSGENERDLPAFLEAIQTAGLYACLRLGPAVNAELTGFGIPQDVLWDEACQARSPRGEPVIVPALPRCFPAPSLASTAFLNEAQFWLENVAQVIAPFAFPKGPVILLQLDSTAAFFSRDALYDQDYHPDSVRAYRTFIQARYATAEQLRNAYGDSGLSFDTLKPPERLNAHTVKGLLRHLDWAEFQEQVVANALGHFLTTLNTKRLAHLPVCHNLPSSAPHTVIDPALITQKVLLLGQNYGQGASERTRSQIECQTSRLVTLAERHQTPAFASELLAGFSPGLAPSSEEETRFAALAALAYGVNAFNIHMAVDRDRWIGAPIGEHGQERPGFNFWQQLLINIEQTGLCSLKRTIEAYLVVPRSYRRLCRALNVMGPANLGFFGGLGLDPEALPSEDTFGLSHSLVEDVQTFLHTLEQAFDQEGVPYAYCSDDDFEFAVSRGRWTLIASSGSLPRKLLENVQTALSQEKAISVGPHDPVFDDAWTALERPLSAERPGAGLPMWIGSDAHRIRQAVKTFAELPGLSRTAPASETHTTLFCDDSGTLQVAFAINSQHTAQSALIFSDQAATDVFTLEAFEATQGAVRVPVAGRTVRMLRF